MKYAKSILLAGEMIDAEQATYDDYKDLIMVCPCCDGEVFLTRGFERASKKGKLHYVSATWKHYSDRSLEGIIECEARSQYTSQQIETRNAVARNQRLKFYRQKMWDLIKRSPLFEGENLEEHIDCVYNDGVLIWVLEVATKVTRNLSPSVIQLENDLLLEYILSDNFECDDDKLKEVRSTIAKDNNNKYLKQVCDEALAFILKNWSGNDLKKAFALALNDDTLNRIDGWFERNYSFLAGACDPYTSSMLTLACKTNRRQAIGIMEKWARKDKEYSQVFTSSLDTVLVSITRVFMVILLSLPWMQEFKKFARQQQESH